MKILNLYSGIGGNRELWEGHEITAVEYDEPIAEVYKKRYPDDTVIVGDAAQYLLDHYKEFDFIWASPPCQTHSRIIFSQYTRDSYKPTLPDMTLYSIISFLQLHGKNKKWCVENVIPYYKPLIDYAAKIDRHLYWSNFEIHEISVQKKYIIKDVKISNSDIDLTGIKNKRQVIRNQVDNKVGKHILDCSTINKTIKEYSD